MIIERTGADIKGVSLEALNAARNLAEQTGGQVVGVVLCAEPDAINKSLENSGVDQVRILTNAGLEDYSPLAYREVLTPLISQAPPFCVLMGPPTTAKSSCRH